MSMQPDTEIIDERCRALPDDKGYALIFVPSGSPPMTRIDELKMAKWYLEKNRSCERYLTPCSNCHKSLIYSQLKKCSRCLIIGYCSRECQVADWPRHKKSEACRYQAKGESIPGFRGQTLAELGRIH